MAQRTRMARPSRTVVQRSMPTIESVTSAAREPKRAAPGSRPCWQRGTRTAHPPAGPPSRTPPPSASSLKSTQRTPRGTHKGHHCQQGARILPGDYARRAGLTVLLDLPRRCPVPSRRAEGSSWSARSRAAARTNEREAGERRRIMGTGEDNIRADLEGPRDCHRRGWRSGSRKHPSGPAPCRTAAMTMSGCWSEDRAQALAARLMLPHPATLWNRA